MKSFRISWRLNAFYLTIVALLVNVCAEITTECHSKLSGQLVAVEGSSILKYNAELENPVLMVKSSFPVSLDYDYGKDILYWSEFTTKEIHAWDSSAVKANATLLISKQGQWMPNSLVVEPSSKKLYVADSFSSTVHLFDLKDENHAVVLGTNLTEVKKIALDPIEGYLFVLDKYQIFRTDLDGENREVIFSELESIDDLLNTLPITVDVDLGNLKQRVYRKSLNLADIALDLVGKRIFWVDSLARRIQSSDYYGENKRDHFHNKEELVGFESLGSLTFFDDHIYWADGLDKKVFKVDVSHENEVKEISLNLSVIKGFDCKTQQKLKNPCANNNGGCEHMCVLSKSNEQNFKCVCNIGYKLSIDGKTCVIVHDFLLYTLANYMRGQVLNSEESTFIDAINPSNFNVGVSTTLDFDAKKSLIFYSSLYPKDQIHQIDLQSGQESVLLPDFLSKHVGKFAYDWITKNLYYFTYYYADMTTLSVMNIDNPTYSKILIDNVTDIVKGIVVNPNKGFLYFAQASDHCSTISRLALDGTDLTVLIELDSHNTIDSLALDDVEERLYWSESRLERENTCNTQIRHSDLNGQDVQNFTLTTNLERLSSIAIREDSVYVISGPSSTIVRLSKKERVEAKTLVDDGVEGSVSGLKVFARASQTVVPENPCVVSNKCQKFCFALPAADGSLLGKCGCPYGEKLDDDEKSCVDNRKEEPPLLPCQSTSYKCKKNTRSLGALGG